MALGRPPAPAARTDTILAVRAVRAALHDDARHLRFPFEEVLWKSA
jgi:hypothetical protein